MLHPLPILGPGTVEDLIADVRLMGHSVTQRMIMDWQTLGLIDYPQHQGGAGRGKGSKKALYSANQRKLFREIIRKRDEIRRVSDLTVIPVSLWLYWGDDYVPLHQVRLALKTFVAGFKKVSKERAAQVAEQLAAQFAHPDAPTTQRTKLVRLLSETIYAGKAPDAELNDVLARVFDPHNEGRQLGPPGARVSPIALIGMAAAREQAARAIEEDTATDEQFMRARRMHLETIGEYLRTQPDLAAASGEVSDLFQAPTYSQLPSRACSDLVTALGLALGRPKTDR